MTESMQSSFIPKNNLPNRPKVGRRYNFFFVSLAIIGIFIATPIAAAVVFIYEQYTKNVVNQVTRELDAAIKTFSDSDLLSVVQFDRRLLASREVFESTESMSSVLKYLLDTTPQTVAFGGVTLSAHTAEHLQLKIDVMSESFDYVMFYRDLLVRNSLFRDVVISELAYQGTEVGAAVAANQSSASKQETNSKLQYTITALLPARGLATLGAIPVGLNREDEGLLPDDSL